VTSSWLGGSAPSRVRRASSSFLDTIPLSGSTSLNDRASSKCESGCVSGDIPGQHDISGKTLLGVPVFFAPLTEPGFLSDVEESELDDEDDEVEDVAEPNESGSDRDKSGRFFLELKRCFGLSLRFGSFIVRKKRKDMNGKRERKKGGRRRGRREVWMETERKVEGVKWE
jgi:hypothetical protein